MLCDISSEIFENPLIVYDDNLLVTALSNEMPGLPDWDYDAESDKKTFPLEILNDFKLDTEFQKSMSTKGSHFLHSKSLGGFIIICGLTENIVDAYVYTNWEEKYS